MLGYIRPDKPQLRICDDEAYTAVKLGITAAMKKRGLNYGFVERLDDFALLGMLELAFGDTEIELTPMRRHGHLLKKIPRLSKEREIAGFAYTTAAAEILMHYLFLSSASRGGFIIRNGCQIVLLSAKRTYAKAKLKEPDLDEYIAEQLKYNEKLTAENCKSIDRASEPVANIVGEVLSRVTKNEAQKTVLRQVGFYLGRYVYILNAFGRVFRDFEKGGFNPLVIGNAVINELNFDKTLKRTEDSVNFTLGALADVYVQLEFERFKPVVDNIVYMGLKKGFYEIAERKKEGNERTAE